MANNNITSGASSAWNAQLSDPEVTVQGPCFPRGGWSWDNAHLEDTIPIDQIGASPNVQEQQISQNDRPIPQSEARQTPEQRFNMTNRRIGPQPNSRFHRYDSTSTLDDGL